MQNFAPRRRLKEVTIELVPASKMENIRGVEPLIIQRFNLSETLVVEICLAVRCHSAGDAEDLTPGSLAGHSEENVTRSQDVILRVGAREPLNRCGCETESTPIVEVPDSNDHRARRG